MIGVLLQTVLDILAPSQQASPERIESDEMTQVLKGYTTENAFLKLTDHSFKLVDPLALKDFLTFNSTDLRAYVSEEHDCDDFAYILMGAVTRWDSDLAFGICMAITPDGTNHALNCFVGTDKLLYLVEPQTDAISPPTEEWKIYLILI